MALDVSQLVPPWRDLTDDQRRQVCFDALVLGAAENAANDREQWKGAVVTIDPDARGRFADVAFVYPGEQ